MSVAFHEGAFHESEPSSSRTLCKIVLQEQISESAVRRDLRFFVFIREDLESLTHLQMSLQRQHFLLSYLKTLSVVPAGV